MFIVSYDLTEVYFVFTLPLVAHNSCLFLWRPLYRNEYATAGRGSRLLLLYPKLLGGLGWKLLFESAGQIWFWFVLFWHIYWRILLFFRTVHFTMHGADKKNAKM